MEEYAIIVAYRRHSYRRRYFLSVKSNRMYAYFRLLDRRRTQRSSVADLRVLYASQMQSLHAQIEGSSKFVPATPGRHIVTQMEGIYSLNPATYKVEHSVKFVLLDDAVLVARKRARRTADRPNLVAERCWPLNDILVLDTKDTASKLYRYFARQAVLNGIQP